MRHMDDILSSISWFLRMKIVYLLDGISQSNLRTTFPGVQGWSEYTRGPKYNKQRYKKWISDMTVRQKKKVTFIKIVKNT